MSETRDNEALRDEFNRWAEQGRGEGMEEDHLPITLPVLDLMQLSPDDNILDVGCGAGWLEQLLSGALELAPGLASARVEETWAGLRPASPDHLPILGPADLEGLLIATGHFRSGIMLAPVTARLIREWVTESRVSIDCERFSPMRFADARREATA